MKRYISSAIRGPEFEDIPTRISIGRDPRTTSEAKDRIRETLKEEGQDTEVVFYFYYADKDLAEYDDIREFDGEITTMVRRVLYNAGYPTDDMGDLEETGKDGNSTEYRYAILTDEIILDVDAFDKISAGIKQGVESLGGRLRYGDEVMFYDD